MTSDHARALSDGMPVPDMAAAQPRPMRGEMRSSEPSAETSEPGDLVGSVYAVSGPSRIVLRRIVSPSVNLVIWRRSVPNAIARWLASSHKPLDADVDMLIEVARVEDALCTALVVGKQVARSGARVLAREAGEFARTLASLTNADVMRVRLEWITSQTCCYFHADRVPLRLLCTYRGAGTEWVSNDAADRLTSPESVPRPEDIQRLGTGDVAIMRGWPKGESFGVPLRHRSPPVAGPPQWRLLLAIDPATDKV
jgi:Protein of unknown function (DUF1826)